MPKKKYNGVTYNTDLDYDAELQNAVNAGDRARAAILEQERNAMRAGEGTGLAMTNDYKNDLPDYFGAAYDNTTDYMKLMRDAAARGDYAAAYNYEKQRNAKIYGEGLNRKITSTYAHYNPETRYKYDPSNDEAYTRAKSQQDQIFERIMNMGEFKYDAESDPVYQQYRKQYMAQGRAAMRDTMGQAAALTGGYGSTYSQLAGEQAYENYLSRLNDVLPELYGEAYNRYRTKRSDLMSEYQLAQGEANAAYDRGHQDWATMLGYERQDEDTAYNRRFAEEQRDYERNLAQEQRDYERQQLAYEQNRQTQQDARSYVLSVLQMGAMPSSAELNAAGMSWQEANDILYRVRLMQQQSFNSGSGGGRSGSGRSSGRSGRSSGGGGSSGYVAPQPQQNPPEFSDTPMNSNRYSGVQRQIVEYAKKGNAAQVKKLLAENKKNMTESQYNSILNLLRQMGVNP